MNYPSGLANIVNTYGDPAAYLRSDGTVHPSWERITLDYSRLPESIPLGWLPEIKVSRMRVHRILSTPLEAIFQEIEANGDWKAIVSFDGTYVWRVKRGIQRLSTHSWGIAIDLNAITNQLGTVGDMPKEIYSVFHRHGWEWGGTWSRADPMHFQAAHGY